MALESRPEAPDPQLLEEALADLVLRSDLDPAGLRWRVEKRMERRRSTVFPMTLESPAAGAVATAYYKAPYLPADLQTERRLTRLQDVLTRSRTLGEEFSRRAADVGVAVNVVLAADPSTLATVTLGLEGRAMGSPVRHLTTRRRRREAIETCERVGRAVSILESLGDASPSATELAEARDAVVRKIGRAGAYLQTSEVGRLESLMHDLLDDAGTSGMPIAHGDLSPTNVLMMDARTGLIDFLWTRQVPGYDLVRFVHRLRHTTLGLASWSERLVRATLEGYGNSDVVLTPSWRLADLTNLLTALQRFHQLGQMDRGPAKRALGELRIRMAE